MVKGIVLLGIFLGLAFLSAGPACADAAEDCKALVESSAAMFKAEGRDATIKAIDAKEGPFVKGDQYVFALCPTDNVMSVRPRDRTLKSMKMNDFKA